MLASPSRRAIVTQGEMPVQGTTAFAGRGKLQRLHITNKPTRTVLVCARSLSPAPAAQAQTQIYTHVPANMMFRGRRKNTWTQQGVKNPLNAGPQEGPWSQKASKPCLGGCVGRELGSAVRMEPDMCVRVGVSAGAYVPLSVINAPEPGLECS